MHAHKYADPEAGARPSFKWLLLGAAAAIVLGGIAGVRPVYAQDSNAAPNDQPADTPAGKAKAKKPTNSETTTVVVTGTHIQGVKPVGSETTTLDHDQIVATGMGNAADVVKTIPQVQNVGDPNGQNYREGGTSGYGGNSTQGTAINLRGVGSAATLTLVDGHRLAPSGAATAFTEANQLPIAAIEKIEIVSDGASAIYGSDAVSGVINFVVRKHFDGTEVGTRYQSTLGNYDADFNLTTGRSWSHLGNLGEGNFIFSLDQEDRSRFKSSKSPFLARDLTRFGGHDNTVSGNTASVPGIPGNLVVQNAGGTTYSYYTLPSGANAHVTGAQLTPGGNFIDPANYSDYLGALHRSQYVLFVNQEIAPWLSVAYEGFYNHRVTVSRGYVNNAANVTLHASNPYYITGAPGVAPGADETIQYNFVKDLGPQANFNPDTSWTQNLSFHASMPAAWKADGFVTFGRDATCGICNFGNNLNMAAFQAQVDAGNINPLSTTPLTPAQLATFMGSNIQSTQNNMNDSGLKFAGPLFDLPAGKLRAAVGLEYEYNKLALQNGANRGAGNVFGWDNTPSAHRTVSSAFVELYVPVIGGSMNVPLVKSLNFDFAARTDHYSDFGSTTNPKIGFTWDVTDRFTVLGSWGKSFRAPALNDINPYVFSYAFVNPFATNNTGDPSIKPTIPGLPYTGAMQFGGANPDLKPETARTWSAGFEYRPRQIEGLSLGMTYYNINYDNQIVFSPPTNLFLSSATYEKLYSKYITVINNTGCVEGNPATYDPKLQKWLNTPFLYGGIAGNICKTDVVIDGRESNLASTHQEGADLHANYFHVTPIGLLTLNGQVTKIINATQTPVDGAAAVKAYNAIYRPVGVRARIGAGLISGGWITNLYLNHTGSYLNNLTISDTVAGVAVQRPYQVVGAYDTLDLTEAYIVPKDSGPKWLRGIRASISMQNVFDRKPPTVLNGTQAYDPANANIFGRVTSLQLTKDF